jgi:type-F conjugative transfer system secretin TraK
MIRRYWLWVISLVMIYIPNSFALQLKPITENGEVQASVAAQELTRIAVEKDRILHVRGLEGAYELKHDPVQGALFIKPLADYQSKPFSLFISTEQNHNYVLHLTPKEQLGDTILLKPKGLKSHSVRFQKHSVPYTKLLVNFMTMMMKDTIPSHYASKTVTKAKCHPMGKAITVQRIRHYSGTHFQGALYRVTNRSCQTWLLRESGFYQRGDCAIALSRLTVAPGGHVLLYKVYSNA